MELTDVLAKRRSVRHFNTKLAVTDEDVQALLEAAISAPSAGNIQPWRFYVVRSSEARERLASALSQRWAAAAPVVIVVAVDPRPCAARYGDRGEYLYSIQDTAAAAENMLLAAVDRGLASCWIGAFDEAAVTAALGMTPPIAPVAILPIGRSAESSGKPARRPLAEVTTWL
ncbi:MAG: nitroreductase family protein [Aeromicrobium sp.]|jgi:nitroreductase|nr:nitroreductase family protein [Aeromicrobium sp.]